MILRANDIDTLILYGIATSGVLLSTLLEAADADLRLAVIKYCCADLDSNLHDCLINKFFSSLLSDWEFVEVLYSPRVVLGPPRFGHGPSVGS
jgi:nicotinamidase-related amidase